MQLRVDLTPYTIIKNDSKKYGEKASILFYVVMKGLDNHLEGLSQSQGYNNFPQF
jgi:hypothetical protein